MRDNS